MRTYLLIALAFAFGLMAFPVEAQKANVGSSGLPLPRFASLRTSQVKLRSGPGVRYPTEWVYLKKALPIEIVSEFENWRWVRDWEGTEGWMHLSMLSGRRMIRVTGVERELRRAPEEGGVPIARVESGVIGKLLQCPSGDNNYCRVEINGYQGWLKRNEFWGTYPGERIE